MTRVPFRTTSYGLRLSSPIAHATSASKSQTFASPRIAPVPGSRRTTVFDCAGRKWMTKWTPRSDTRRPEPHSASGFATYAARTVAGLDRNVNVTEWAATWTASRNATMDRLAEMGDTPGKDVPFPPMEAELVSELPGHSGWRYEPKWDGFRGVLENDGGELALWSRNGRPLLRYFPELRRLGELLPPHSALDGEIVISRNGALDFDAMQMRLHPAESRVRKLSAEIPATFVAFDLLLWNKKKLHAKPIEERRAELEKVAAGIPLSPVSDDVAQGLDWLQTLQAAGFDGVVAKKLGLPYLPGSRDGVVKVKPHKTADCVVAGLRWKAGGRSTIATLLLGLYRDDGHLDYVGSCAIGAKNQAEIAEKVLPLLDEKSERRFSEPNRWGTNGLEEAALKPELVVEVRFDKLEKSRFRHGTKLIRFRPDKDPDQCTWREVRPARRPDDLAVEDLLA